MIFNERFSTPRVPFLFSHSTFVIAHSPLHILHCTFPIPHSQFPISHYFFPNTFPKFISHPHLPCTFPILQLPSHILHPLFHIPPLHFTFPSLKICCQFVHFQYPVFNVTYFRNQCTKDNRTETGLLAVTVKMVMFFSRSKPMHCKT